MRRRRWSPYTRRWAPAGPWAAKIYRQPRQAASIDAMKIYSWNVNGIRAVHKKGLFLSFIEAHQPDILCLQETKAERGQVEIDLPNYREHWNSAVKKGYSGTAIFSKQEPLTLVDGFPSDFAQRFTFADEL